MYHCWCVDPTQPCRPTLEVEALLRPGDADATSGPLLLSVADYLTMAGQHADGDRLPRRAAGEGPGRRAPRRAPPRFPTWTDVGSDARVAEELVEPAGPQAGEVERDPAVAGGGHRVDDRLALGQHGVEVELGHLDAGDLAVVPHPELGEPERPQGGLGPLHRGQATERDGGAVGQAGREAGGGGLVPRVQPELVGDLAHPVLGEPGVDQRERGAPLGGRLLARSVVAEVVEVDPEADRGAALGGQRAERLEQRVLAPEAAVAVVAGVAGVVELVGGDLLPGHPPARRQVPQASRSSAGQRRRHGGDGHRARRRARRGPPRRGAPESAPPEKATTTASSSARRARRRSSSGVAGTGTVCRASQHGNTPMGRVRTTQPRRVLGDGEAIR